MSIKVNNLIFGFCLFFSVCYSLLYSNYLIKDPILGRDDVLLILPLKNISSFGGYIEAVKNNTILDFQPIRDLSFFINIKLIEWAGISTFHFTNFVLFFVTIFLFMKILDVLGFSKRQILFSSLLYTAHPLMISSVGWISARKHTLALIFLLLSLIDYIKNKKITNKSIAWYTLSILSHQIFILFPVWIFIYSKVNRMIIHVRRFLLMSFLGFLVLFLGILKTFYLEMGNVTYKYYHWSENISRYALSVGRSVIQILFPVSISGDYFQGSLLNLVGIPVLIVCIFICYKSKSAKDSLIWLGLAFLAHILTYITFVNDTYLYLPLMCSIVAANYFFTSCPIKVDFKVIIASVLICFSLLMSKTLISSQMWRTDIELWKQSYKNEPSPFTSILLGSHLLKLDEKSALELIVWGARNYDLISNKNILMQFLQTIYTSSLSIQTKIQIYKDCYRDHVIYNAFYGTALLEGTNEQMSQGLKILKPILQKEETYTPNSHGLSIIKAIRYLCLNFKDKDQACKELAIAY